MKKQVINGLSQTELVASFKDSDLKTIRKVVTAINEGVQIVEGEVFNKHFTVINDGKERSVTISSEDGKIGKYLMFFFYSEVQTKDVAKAFYLANEQSEMSEIQKQVDDAIRSAITAYYEFSSMEYIGSEVLTNISSQLRSLNEKQLKNLIFYLSTSMSYDNHCHHKAEGITSDEWILPRIEERLKRSGLLK